MMQEGNSHNFIKVCILTIGSLLMFYGVFTIIHQLYNISLKLPLIEEGIKKAFVFGAYSAVYVFLGIFALLVFTSILFKKRICITSGDRSRPAHNEKPKNISR